MKKYIAVVLTVILSEIFGIALHELSHLIVLIAFKGNLTGLNFGVVSSVEGYVPYKAVPYIAMAPFVIPTILFLTCLTFKLIRKHFYASLVVVVLSGATVRTTLMNLIALCINPVNAQTRATWDLILAIDSSIRLGYVFVIVSILCVIASSYVFYRHIRALLALLED